MSFELQPTLQGELLLLRPLKPSDFERLYAVASDPLIWEQHPNRDRFQKAVFESFFRDAMESKGALVAMDIRNGEIIGSSRFYGYNSSTSEVEIGWSFLARSYWGGRYNGEMKSLMLRHAFQFVRNVVFVIGETNIRSQRAAEKIGAVRVEPRESRAGRCIYQITA